MLGVLLVIAAFPLAASAYTLTVELESARWGKDSVVMCGIYSAPGDFNPRLIKDVAASERQCSFENIPSGVYTVLAFQDLNNNGILDRNFLTLPTEPWGASNNERSFFGPPEFRDAAFPVNGDTTIRIKLDY